MRRALLPLLLSATIAPAVGQTVADRLPVCLACHGDAGLSATANTPSLGGEPADYLLVQLYLFREKQRHSDIMNAMTSGLTDDDLRTVSDRLAQLAPPKVTGDPLTDQDREQGQALVAKYHCASCHNADLAGHDQIPRLADQREDYLLKSLREYKSNARAGYEPAMNEVAQEVKETDMPALARYMNRFKPSDQATGR